VFTTLILTLESKALVLGQMDLCRDSLKALAWAAGCLYTRYADDVTFSTRAAVFPKSIVAHDRALKNWVLSAEIVDVVEENTFKVNAYKTRVRSKHSSQEVTGVRINKGLNVNKELYQQVRTLLRVWENWGEDGAQSSFWLKLPKLGKKNSKPKLRDVLRGKIEFIGFIKGRDHPVYVKLLQRLQKLDSSINAKPIMIRATSHESIIRQAIWLLFDHDQNVQGTAFAIEGGCLLTAAHNLDEFMWASRPSFSDEKFIVKIVHKDDGRDIASVKINAPLPIQLKFGALEQIFLTSAICVIGFPNYHKGDSVAFRFGKVVQERSYLSIPHFVVDADIVKGNSGGPVLDSQNRVIGVAVKGLQIPGALNDDDQLSSFVPISKCLFPHL